MKKRRIREDSSGWPPAGPQIPSSSALHLSRIDVKLLDLSVRLFRAQQTSPPCGALITASRVPDEGEIPKTSDSFNPVHVDSTKRLLPLTLFRDRDDRFFGRAPICRTFPPTLTHVSCLDHQPSPSSAFEATRKGRKQPQRYLNWLVTMVLFRSLAVAIMLAFPASEAFAPSISAAGTTILQERTATTAPAIGARSNSNSNTELHALFGIIQTPPPETSVVDPLYNRHSASDWLYNIRSFPQSKVLREIRNPVLAVTGWSFVVSLVHRLCESSSSAVLRTFAMHMNIPGTAHSYLVSALGLLLVFRTNSAYQRFNEGRKIWENILSVSRNLTRMVQLYANDVGPERRRRILNLVAAYPYLLRQHIRPGCLCNSKGPSIPDEHRLLLVQNRPSAQETRHEGQIKLQVPPPPTECWVDTRELPWSLFMKSSLPGIAKAENRPLWVCDRISALMATIPYGPNFTSRERLSLLGMVDKLTNAIGQCERIHQTAVPLNYARHSLRSLTVWLFTLPFALTKDLGLFTAPVIAVTAWLFFGVYQIGYSIEDPFQGSLRLSILCDAIRRNVMAQTTDMRDSAFYLDGDTDDEPALEPQQQPRASPLLVDENILNAPKIFSKNGTTWTEVGI